MKALVILALLGCQPDYQCVLDVDTELARIDRKLEAAGLPAVSTHVRMIAEEPCGAGSRGSNVYLDDMCTITVCDCGKPLAHELLHCSLDVLRGRPDPQHKRQEWATVLPGL